MKQALPGGRSPSGGRRKYAASSALTVILVMLFSMIGAGVASADQYRNGYWIYGEIDKKFRSFGFLFPGGPPTLGEPNSPELDAARSGKWQAFGLDTNRILWNGAPNIGAHQLGGLILQKWLVKGDERGFLGYPITDELPATNGKHNNFEGGSIYWRNGTTQAFVVTGNIRDQWAAQNYENGPLGYPTSDEYDLDGGKRQNFQGGQLSWNVEEGLYNGADKPNLGRTYIGPGYPVKKYDPRADASPGSDCQVEATGPTLCFKRGGVSSNPGTDARQRPESLPIEPGNEAPAEPGNETTESPTTTPSEQSSTTESTTTPVEPSAAAESTTTPSEQSSTTESTTTPVEPSAAVESTTTPAEPTVTVPDDQTELPAQPEGSIPVEELPADAGRAAAASSQIGLRDYCDDDYPTKRATLGLFATWTSERTYGCSVDPAQFLYYENGRLAATLEAKIESELNLNYATTKMEYRVRITEVDRTYLPNFGSAVAVLDSIAVTATSSCSSVVSCGRSEQDSMTREPLSSEPFGWTNFTPAKPANGSPRNFDMQYQLVATASAPIRNGRVNIPPPTTRCDNENGVPGFMTGVLGAGCVFPTYVPTSDMSDNSRFGTVKSHMMHAQMSGLPGAGRLYYTGPLERTLNNAVRQGNYQTSCKGKYLDRPAGYECDEYPFQTTYQGAASNSPGPARTFSECTPDKIGLPTNATGRGGYSVCLVPRIFNQNQGEELSQFYYHNRLIDRDQFFVRADTGS